MIFPITATSSPTSAAGGHPPEQVDAMRAPWFKAVTVHATVWAQPYAPERFGAVTAANAAALVAAGLLGGDVPAARRHPAPGRRVDLSKAG